MQRYVTIVLVTKMKHKMLFLFIMFSFLTAAQSIKQPNVAGKFYPTDKTELTNMINGLIAKTTSGTEPRTPWAIIVPHAGYEFSGQTAAYAYKILKDKKYKTVVILGPAHTVNFSGIAVYPQGKFQTPLGDVPIDTEAVSEMVKIGVLRADPPLFEKEHSLEVQLPFLQTVLGDFKIVPVLMGQPSLAEIQKFKKALAEVVKRGDVLVVASTDLSHYKPAKINDALDAKTIGYIKKTDVLGLYQAVYRQECELCGFWPVLTLLELAADKPSEIIILDKSNSGYATGDYRSVVGYTAVGFFDKQNSKEVSKNMEFNLSDKEKKSLLKLAREAIASRLNKKPWPSADLGFEKANLPGAAFVTLHKKDELRGCIGHIRAVKPLAETIREMAQAAAFEDPRFFPVKKDELGDLHIEISVLSPMDLVNDINEIEIGRDGLYIAEGYNSGLLLPQVATEEKWTREQFLEGVCRKAGLPGDAWQKGALLYKFSAEIFQE